MRSMREWKEKRGNMLHYDQQSAIYDVQYVKEQDTKIDDILKNMNFSSNEQVLDLGCGTGFLFQHLNKKARLVVGVDVSRNALTQAKKRTKNRPNVDLVCADADNTPFPDHIFDKIFAITVLQNMPEPKKTLTEMKRTAKIHGVFAVTGLKKKFSQESFVELHRGAQLKVVKLNVDQRLKDHVALCVNLEGEL